ncbi:MAG: ABC transporter ATP-binding protein [Candidatus Tectomicrobia bacterium]|nr:ABC transporter ATP-binding protein [Candidatus Tectomicrobia bacterium]
MISNNVILDVKNLTVDFRIDEEWVRAVDDVSFAVRKGEIVGLVGESGAGKSMTSEAVLRLIRCPPGRVQGEVFYKGEDLLKLSESQLSKIRGSEIAMIFQDPVSSLNPVYQVGSQIFEALAIHLNETRRSLRGMVTQLMTRVGIPAPETRKKNYPHQFSGGMSQRVMIAMGVSCTPTLLIADEPTTSLDVTIQAQILSLIRKLARETGTAVLLVSHDLGIISQMCDRVIVMYAGKVVEEAPMAQIFSAPAHPYTRGLIDSIPKVDRVIGRLESIPGVMPSLLDIPSGCRFHPRCHLADETCKTILPELRSFGEHHRVACHKA